MLAAASSRLISSRGGLAGLDIVRRSSAGNEFLHWVSRPISCSASCTVASFSQYILLIISLVISAVWNDASKAMEQVSRFFSTAAIASGLVGSFMVTADGLPRIEQTMRSKRQMLFHKRNLRTLSVPHSDITYDHRNQYRVVASLLPALL